jgi:hypothetical protein
MATIAENLQTIKDSTAAIKQSIINKGGEISGNITTWASAIDGIETGGGGEVTKEKDVNFYDYDGTILHSFFKDEFLALSSLPDLPTREGLTCQGWNYTLSDAKDYVEAYDRLAIGATYITDDGCTRLYIRIAAEGRMDVPLYFYQSVSDGVVIDWGDGSATETLSAIANVNCTHTYAKTGDYVISLRVASGTLGLGRKSYSYCVLGSTSTKVYVNMLQKVEIGSGVTAIYNYAFDSCYSLASVVIPNSVTSIGYNAFDYCYSLASVVIPNSVTSIGNNAFRNCVSLASVVIPNSVTNIEHYAFYTCYSLASVVIPNSVTSIKNNAFRNCVSLASVVIPNSVTNIENNAFYSCSGVAFFDFTSHTAIPTLTSTSAFTEIASDCEIRVPTALVDDWKAATNWSTYADKIVGY